MTTPPPHSRRPVTRTQFHPGEARTGLTWLSVGAGMAGLVEVASISSAYGVPSILAAAGLGAVFTRTALLWVGKHTLRALVPLIAWLCVFALLALGPEVTATLIDEHKIRSAILLAAACGGGVWPIVARK